MTTIPAPPPNGVSSTVRWTSVVCSRRSWTRTSNRPLAAARPSRLWLAKSATMPGKMVKTSMRTAATGSGLVEVEEPGRHVDHQASVGVTSLEEAQGHQGTRVEHQEVAGRVVLHRFHDASL